MADIVTGTAQSREEVPLQKMSKQPCKSMNNEKGKNPRNMCQHYKTIPNN